jgi:23S rRNA pseudouridine1911/1915/1917 synthase
MAKTDYVELPDGSQVSILHEDRAVMAIDKPPGWMLGPEDEEHVRRNLHIALTLGIEAGSWWAKCRSLKFVRFIHRLDAPTTGVLLLAKSRGALAPYGKLFATRLVQKTYLAVTDRIPKEREWTCTLPLGPDPAMPGRHRVEPENGKESETRFKVLRELNGRALIEAYPLTGRTHQIRLHLLAAGCPVTGDILYGKPHPAGLGLRAVELCYPDPFDRRPIRIRADRVGFETAFGFGPEAKPAVPAVAVAPVAPVAVTPAQATATATASAPAPKPAPRANPTPTAAPRTPPVQTRPQPKQKTTKPMLGKPRRPMKPGRPAAEPTPAPGQQKAHGNIPPKDAARGPVKRRRG